MNDSNLIWIDLEMTGLNTQTDVIIEIATVITNSQLEIIAEGPVLAIHQAQEKLDAMDKWNQRQHKKSGLVDRVNSSTVTETEAEIVTINFIKEFVSSKKSPMCGNSICQDRRFLARCMPKLEDFFHYRNLDVSAVKEIALRWYPKLPKFKKKSKHLAMQDIIDSIEELKYYREHLFKADIEIK